MKIHKIEYYALELHLIKVIKNEFDEHWRIIHIIKFAKNAEALCKSPIRRNKGRKKHDENEKKIIKIFASYFVLIVKACNSCITLKLIQSQQRPD